MSDDFVASMTTHETENVVNNFVVGESSVTTLMTDNPDTSEDEALEPPAKAKVMNITHL